MTSPTRDDSVSDGPPVGAVLDRVRAREFHPLDETSFTIDRTVAEHGIADLADEDWRVRLLAVRDLVRGGDDATADIAAGLRDDDVQVRYVCATALGVLRARSAVDALERVVREDPDPLARSQAIVALGRIGADESLALLRDRLAADDSKDVRHQAELAVDRIEKGAVAEPELAAAFRALDPEAFGRVTVGESAPAFELPDTDGRTWDLEDAVGGDGDGWTVLIWVFADWCPVCHREFDELIELREELADANVTVATVECHEAYRGRVMVGQELEPEYWFADEPFAETYTDRIWWPHLIDRAGAVGAAYGVDPMAYAVHAEYINRPATVVIDPEGTVRFAYYGTFWGDRPSVEETLEMIRTETFAFEHPERRSSPAE
ncbi:alkyl hydroperoxide reductase/ Thiol specific antioxidant/ Mal allergen [Halorubrum aidingense JCM 13560]|uniref:Alkyl hydroperoxide reductase/ Thiol specific antioxidant/ Mal allergen n=1 Tax=Halorubrum aidingense JCM 13560 TaxID=1230454 RepID=M0PDD5_9EURY|nr:redoxin domain-containing protein [Halorubrum aidingense]EMA67519.1 alkyl hydroperoxide reductase/ Thiol specific antioxidant/ Mal allergen [Halorubrum aidingense JCM 13560]